MAETVVSPEEEIVEFGAGKKAKSEYEVMDPGEYEVEITKVEPKRSEKNGKVTDYWSIEFTIRNDVDQKYNGKKEPQRKIWWTIFKKDYDGVAYNFNKVNEIIVTQEGTKNYQTHFKTTDEVMQYLYGLHLRLKIDVQFNAFKSKEDNIIQEGAYGKDKDGDDITFMFSQWDKDHPREKPDAHLEPVGDSGAAKGANLDQVDIPDDACPF